MKNSLMRQWASVLRLRGFISLALVDIIAIVTGFAVAAVVRDAIFGDPGSQFLFVIVLPLYFIAAFNNHAFSSQNLHDPFIAVRRGLKSLAFALAAILILGYSVRSSMAIPRFVATFGFLLSCVILTGLRYVVSRYAERIIGGDPFSTLLMRDADQPIPPGDFTHVVDVGTFDPEARDPHLYDWLAKLVQGADRIVIACNPDKRAAWAHAMKGISVQSEIITAEIGPLAPLGVGRCGNLPTMVVSIGPLGFAERITKRGLDLLLTIPALLLLSPFIFAIAIAIKMDSAGPILFRQTRIGQDNEMFSILKFRSMRVESSDRSGTRSAERDDERVTKVGRFIRATSLDELPQLLNVLRGEMSIVGPRPHALGSRAADKLFWEIDARYWHRHTAKPGLTGLAQIRGFRGATFREIDLYNRLQADLEYLENWSVWRDLKIILLTFRVIVHRNAF